MYKYYLYLGKGWKKWPMWTFMVLMTNLQLNYIAVPFVILEYTPSWKLISCVYFYGHGLMALFMILGRIFPPPRVHHHHHGHRHGHGEQAKTNGAAAKGGSDKKKL